MEELRHASCAKVILHQGAGVTLGHARIELRLDGANAVVGEPLRGAEGLQLFQVEASEFHGDSGGWVDRMSLIIAIAPPRHMSFSNDVLSLADTHIQPDRVLAGPTLLTKPTLA